MINYSSIAIERQWPECAKDFWFNGGPRWGTPDCEACDDGAGVLTALIQTP